MSSELEDRFARVVEHHVLHGALPSLQDIAGDRPDLVAPLRVLVDRYLDVTMALDSGSAVESAPAPRASSMPSFDGFQTVQRIGGGGMGEVYKLKDLKLDRFVAAKVMRADRKDDARLADSLREARAMARFTDRRVVQVFDVRDQHDPPVIIMEYVEGFELGRVAPSLEFRQRARLVADVADAIDHVHGLGITHRDLKPSNIMLDGSLSPKILDFGLSSGDPASGHLRGTPSYLAPEQLDPSQPIDARTDVYALGVILYELVAGAVPYAGRDVAELVAAIRAGAPRLPVEIDPRVPEPLQAVALKAMEKQPADRYQSAREMRQDLLRYVEGRPVLAHPSHYASTLGARVRPHLDQISEWLRLRLIYPHEADRIRSAYRQLDAREDDWIASSRALSYSQIVLYFGAFLLFVGSLLYFGAHRFHGAVTGLTQPFLVLALPFLGLNLAGRHLYLTERKAVAIAFFLAGVSLLPLFLLIWFHEAHLWVVPEHMPGQLFQDGSVSNRQLQLTILVAFAWSGWLAWRTTTSAMSTVFTVLGVLLAFAILGDFGLRDWIEGGRYDRLGLHLAPLAIAYGASAVLLDRSRRTWLARPLYVAAGLTVVLVLDLVALDGRTFHYLDVSMQRFNPADVTTPALIDTLAALTLNGIAFYLLASALERWGLDLMKVLAGLLFVISPFSMLEPLAYLVETAEYSKKADWLYLALAVTVAVLSHHRQRKSFYYAGLINSGFALYLVTDRYAWFDWPRWAEALVAIGLVALVSGFGLDRRERSRQT